MSSFAINAGPARLMRGADAAAGVAVEVFVERHVIAIVRIGLQLADTGAAPGACRPRP